MKQSIEKILCDSCGTILKEPGFYINNGSFQEPFQKIGDKDICHTCMGKIFSQYIRLNKIPHEVILPLIDTLKPLGKRDRDFGGKISESAIFSNAISSEDVNKYAQRAWDKINNIGKK